MPTPSGEPQRRLDETIAQLLSDRNPEGLRLLLREHGPRVLGQLQREFRNLDRADLDEALSRASHRVWQRFATFDPSRGTLRAWFSVVARNCALEAWRQQQREGKVFALQEAEAVYELPTEAGETAAEPSAFVRALRACIRGLPRLQRAVIEADLRSAEVADAAALAHELDTTKNSIYVSRSLARKSLKSCLQGRGFAPAESAGKPLASSRGGSADD